MTGTLGLVVALGLVTVFGLPAAFLPNFRDADIATRLGLAFLTGALLLTAHAVLLSAIDVVWTVWTIGLPLLVLAATVSLVSDSGQALNPPDRIALPRTTVIAVGVCLVGLVGAVWVMMSSRHTSSDLLFFWGVKGALFADAGGIDTELLGWRFFKHAHITYPPLVTVLYAWITLIAGDLPWKWLPPSTFVWVVAAAPVIRHMLRLKMSSNGAALTTAAWTAAIASSLLFSSSGGNAEAPLVAYLAVACAAALSLSPSHRVPQMTVMIIGVAGACLTKNEGRIAAVLLIMGVITRDVLRSRTALRTNWIVLIGVMAAVIGGWAAFLYFNGLPISDPVRETAFQLTFVHVDRILASLKPNLGAGSAGIVWLVIAGGILFGCPKPIDNLPLLTLGAGLSLFVVVYYLHSHVDPTLLINCTLRRLIQPVLSAGILWAGASWFAVGDCREP